MSQTAAVTAGPAALYQGQQSAFTILHMKTDTEAAGLNLNQHPLETAAHSEASKAMEKHGHAEDRVAEAPPYHCSAPKP